MFCPNCGIKLKNKSQIICERCGMDLSTELITKDSNTYNTPQDSKELISQGKTDLYDVYKEEFNHPQHIPILYHPPPPPPPFPEHLRHHPPIHHLHVPPRGRHYHRRNHDRPK